MVERSVSLFTKKHTVTIDKIEMGVFAKISRRVFPFRHGVKDGLTMVTTAEDENAGSISGGETSATTMHSDDEVEPCRRFVAEPLSPHHGAIMTTPAPQSRGTHTFFSDDLDQKLYIDDDDDTMMGSMILLHASNCSSGSAGSFEEDNRDAVTSSSDFGAISKSDCSILENIKAKVDIVEEPSFEIALMEASPEVPPSPLKQLSLAFKIPRKTSNSSSDFGRRHDRRSMKPQKRFDQNGRPFVHVYTEGLSTLYEYNEDTPVQGAHQPSLHASSEDIACEKRESDDPQLQAHWTIASHQLKHEGKECESNTSSIQRCQSKWYQGHVSPRNGP